MANELYRRKAGQQVEVRRKEPGYYQTARQMANRAYNEQMKSGEKRLGKTLDGFA